MAIKVNYGELTSCRDRRRQTPPDLAIASADLEVASVPTVFPTRPIAGRKYHCVCFCKSERNMSIINWFTDGSQADNNGDRIVKQSH